MAKAMFDNFIDGQWVGSTERIPNVSPSDTNDVLGDYAQANAEQGRAAISAAVTAQPTWQATGLEHR